MTRLHLVEAGPRTQVRGIHSGLPTWFRGSCYKAAHGGTDGYFEVGRKLALALSGETPDDIEWDEWTEEIATLDDLLARDDDAPVWGWFCGHLPKFANLIPARRRHRFIAGVRHLHEREGGHIPL